MATGNMPGTARNAAIQAQFAHQQKLAQIVRVERAISAQNADGDGQIEARAFLLQVGGREVDGDVRGRDLVAGVFDSGAHAVAALAHGGVGQADGVEDFRLRDHAAIVHLDINEIGIDAVDSRAVSLEKHAGRIESECSRREGREASGGGSAGEARFNPKCDCLGQKPG
jgi:hypothetical protein